MGAAVIYNRGPLVAISFPRLTRRRTREKLLTRTDATVAFDIITITQAAAVVHINSRIDIIHLPNVLLFYSLYV